VGTSSFFWESSFLTASLLTLCMQRRATLARNTRQGPWAIHFREESPGRCRPTFGSTVGRGPLPGISRGAAPSGHPSDSGRPAILDSDARLASAVFVRLFKFKLPRVPLWPP
jgi:hypothetical protein